MTKNEWMRWSYHTRRTKFIELLGGKCVRCEATENLEFDHIDPKTKSTEISQLLTYRIETFLKELSKCQLLCNTCHKLKNKKDVGEAKHGSLSMYRHHKCRCYECCKNWNEATRRWKKSAKYKVV